MIFIDEDNDRRASGTIDQLLPSYLLFQAIIFAVTFPYQYYEHKYDRMPQQVTTSALVVKPHKNLGYSVYEASRTHTDGLLKVFHLEK